MKYIIKIKLIKIPIIKHRNRKHLKKAFLVIYINVIF